ncbi:uncharacterized protein K452DRAFT_324144 [Aplosporella prunicola CBS 121167]|uniref:PUM-HD domain-containing protein n=1 Tax=Aplosporella prunicola CBS 121167 TaxID=1176127 RepID=A0A6A6BU06_9PEZI|nr:uncharacterized protein K452DRAFT_324144 [Aplosporella prunicola CBS 121167]KAF2146111.1 hypothetical protein K452DRAFT_324144 [Aplosporella prunicola CBS 121167]
MTSDGSPVPRNSPSGQLAAQRDDAGIGVLPSMLGNVGVKRNNQMVTRASSPIPLTTSKLGNQNSLPSSRVPSKKLKTSPTPPAAMPHPSDDSSFSPMDNLMAKLSEQQVILNKQRDEIGGVAETLGPRKEHLAAPPNDGSSSGSVSISAGSEKYIQTPESFDIQANVPDAAEVLRLKKQLEAANSRIARMDEELSQTRITKHTVDQALGPPSEAGFDPRNDVSEQTLSKLQYTFNASTRIPPVMGRQEPWPVPEDAVSDSSDALSAGGFNRQRNHAIWNNIPKPSVPYQLPTPIEPNPAFGANWNNGAVRQPFSAGVALGHGLGLQPFGSMQQGQRFDAMGPAFPIDGVPGVPGIPGVPRGNNQIFMEPVPPYSIGRSNPPSRPSSRAAFDMRYNTWATNYTPGAPGGHRYSPPVSPMPGMPHHGMFQPPAAYQPGPIGTRLSPTAAEFNVGRDSASGPWNPQPIPETSVTTYISPNEPINYRRLLDRNMSCDWKLIVDKIVCNNDQQASIFLQQKLKVGTAEQKFEIVEAIIAQAYPLMINRFGNFLVQRCFEHGTQDQVISIANAIRGNVLTLSMDAFGCHVIQKAFDAVPEDYKAIMVHELLRRIPETVVHRYACHVWQKLFELRWSDSPPQIMKYVNEALRGMWHEVALGETGSLVVQNIFENCLEEDKRPCINEVLASIDVIAHGQFGNWCIQHICEHGSPPDRTRAIDHILRYATEYSMDQYASKVIEKCLKIGGTEFLDRYLDRVCESRADRPRLPLVDIAGDQFGNYLIQYILSNASPQHREIVAGHVRKHMVSLRGSKYGSRVAMLCCNPAFATRPGPPTGMQLNRHNSYGGRGSYGGYR